MVGKRREEMRIRLGKEEKGIRLAEGRREEMKMKKENSHSLSPPGIYINEPVFALFFFLVFTETVVVVATSVMEG